MTAKEARDKADRVRKTRNDHLEQQLIRAISVAVDKGDYATQVDRNGAELSSDFMKKMKDDGYTIRVEGIAVQVSW